jgi:hypothetical protein
MLLNLSCQPYLVGGTSDLKGQPAWAANPSEAPQGDAIARTPPDGLPDANAMPRGKSTEGRSPRSLAAAMRRVSEAN